MQASHTAEKPCMALISTSPQSSPWDKFDFPFPYQLGICNIKIHRWSCAWIFQVVGMAPSRPLVPSHTARSTCREKVMAKPSPWTGSFGRSGFERNFCLIKLIRTGSQRNTMRKATSTAEPPPQRDNEPEEQIGPTKATFPSRYNLYWRR
jgi:hypothetical protein